MDIQTSYQHCLQLLSSVFGSAVIHREVRGWDFTAMGVAKTNNMLLISRCRITRLGLSHSCSKRSCKSRRFPTTMIPYRVHVCSGNNKLGKVATLISAHYFVNMPLAVNIDTYIFPVGLSW